MDMFARLVDRLIRNMDAYPWNLDVPLDGAKSHLKSKLTGITSFHQKLTYEESFGREPVGAVFTLDFALYGAFIDGADMRFSIIKSLVWHPGMRKLFYDQP